MDSLYNILNLFYFNKTVSKFCLSAMKTKSPVLSQRRLPSASGGQWGMFFFLFFALDCGYGPALGLGRLLPFLSLGSGFGPASGSGRLPARGRGQGLAQPLAPYNPVPRVGAALLDGQQDYTGYPPLSSLPRGSGRSASRCPAPTRDERPSGVGASAPFGAAISSAPCPACVNKAESSPPLHKRHSIP